MKKIIFYTLLIAFTTSCNNNNGSNNENDQASGNVNVAGSPAIINYSVVNIFPHDVSSFTEGLLVHEGKLYESTGSPDSPENNGSWFGIVDMKTGKADIKAKLDTLYFGEGISILNDRIYQLTWQNQKGFVYDATTFKKLQEFTYTGDGWGMTTDSTNLIMSDGTNKLRYLDPVTLKVQKIVGVEDNNGPVSNINELEYIDGYIYANQWLTNYILKIDPSSGKVTGKLDLSNLATEAKNKYPGAGEMNGIAYDKESRKIYVTGKFWPNIYEIKFN